METLTAEMLKLPFLDAAIHPYKRPSARYPFPESGPQQPHRVLGLHINLVWIKSCGFAPLFRRVLPSVHRLHDPERLLT